MYQVTICMILTDVYSCFRQQAKRIYQNASSGFEVVVACGSGFGLLLFMTMDPTPQLMS